MKKIYMILAAMTLLSMSLNAQTTYEKVTSTDQLVVGNKYIFVSEEANTAMTATASNSRLTGESVTITSNTVTLSSNSNVAVFTLGGSSNSWTLVNGGKYLTGADKSTNLTLATSQGTYSTWRLNNNNDALSGYRAVNSSNTSRAVLYRTSANQFGGYATSNIGSNSDYSYAFLYVEASTAPTIQVSTNSLSMSAAPGSSATETVTVTGRNLTDGINYTLTDANGVFSVNRPSMGSEGGTLTVTYSPTAVGTHTATLTLSSNGAQDVTIPLNGTSSYTIGDGTSSDYYLPAYGSYQDYGYKNQMIYTAAQLAEIGIQNGDKITSITFYPTTASGYNGGIDFYGSTVTLSLGNTNVSSFSGSKITPSDLTDMVTITPVRDNNATEWTFSWSTPFTYTGGNLLVQVYCPGYEKDGTNGDYGRTYFKGDNKNSNVSLYSYNSSASSTSGTSGTTGTNSTFQPQASFTFESSVPVHDLGITLSEPTAVVAGENATITATVTNNGNQTESGYTVTFSDGTNTFSTQTGGTLAPGATETFTATYTTSAAGTVTITANVACTDDSDATNDEATTTLTVNAPIHDLGITLSAPAEVVGGNSATVTATVTNNGNQPMSGYTVTITDGTNTLLTQTVNEALAPGATATFTATYATTEAQVGTTVNFTATVACTGDADATNNSATASTAVITLPPPENVVATPDNNNMSATVTWDPPIIDPVIETVTEDFEDTSVFPTFTTGGVNANSRTGAFGNWTLYEGTGLNCYGSNDVDFGTDVEQTCYAWMPFDLTATTPAWTVTNISARSGQQFMNSMGASGGSTTDHWLISPELSGNAQTITFYDAEMKTDWGAETYEVLYSTTDNNYTSFTSLGTYSADALTWDAESANLPADAKYFAIRHTSADIFGLMIDDVTYEAKLPGLQPISYNVYLDGEFMGNVAADAALTYNFSNLASGGHTASVSAVYPGGIESAAVPAEFTILPTPNAPTVSSNDGTTSTTITITPDANTDGQLVYHVDYNGSQTQDLTFPRGANDYTVEVHAYTTATSNYNQSPEAVVTVTIPALPQTAAPTIGISSQTDNEVVITATGNGTVILNIPGYEPATGNGSASITVPRHMSDYVVTATATAQASGELISPTTTEPITVPGMSNDGWTQMTGTYNNPNDLLSFEVKVGNDTTDIMLIDQFMASTVYNNHPDKYTYVLKETKVINGVDSTMTSNPATIPVYKTNSTMYSLYTEEEVLADNKYDDNKLKANVLNSEIDYDVVPDNNVLYYSLYRGGKDEPTPVVDVDHRISQLQKFEDKVGDNVTYYLTENHLSGITPRYEHIGSQIVERLDMDYVTGTDENKLSYVPVIWTFGLYTARGDGKNNSYGSDIKNSYLGKVDISVTGFKNDGDSITGQWKDGEGTTYCVYAPIITLHGFTPEDVGANDGDTYQYVPYMYRVWCTYTNAHNFTHVANPDGKKRLVDAGPIEAPFLIGQVTADNPAWNNNGEEVIIGRALESGEAQQPWSFGVPVNESSKNVEFVARFYYKKIVTPAAQVNGLRGNRGDARAFAIAEKGGDGKDIQTGISELGDITYVVSRTYVNAQGMQSDVPFDGLNIVITRYSDGTTSTTKVVR